MRASVPILRKPILGAFRPDADGRCVVCSRRRLCSASCREVAKRLSLAPKKRVRPRRAEPTGPAWDIAYLSYPTRHLIMVGKALYGERWQRPIARDLGVNSRTIVRWMRGEGRPTTDDLRRLEAVARQRCAGITAAVEALVDGSLRFCMGTDRAPPRERKAPPVPFNAYGGLPRPRARMVSHGQMVRTTIMETTLAVTAPQKTAGIHGQYRPPPEQPSLDHANDA
jgi:transcriptional regulator with XRE-family HTH domain